MTPVTLGLQFFDELFERDVLVSVRIQTAATAVGLAMIGSIFLLTLFYDAKRLLGL